MPFRQLLPCVLGFAITWSIGTHSISLKGGLKGKFLLMQINKTVDWCRLSLKIFGYLVSFSSYPPFGTIGWWRHFVCKKQRKYTRFIIFPEGNWHKKGFFKLKCFSKHRINSWGNFYYFLHLRWNVFFNCNLSKIRYTFISIHYPCDLQAKWRHQRILEICG